MKKKLLYVLLTLCMAFTLAGFIACDKDEASSPAVENGWGTIFTMETAYAQAQELGYDGTLEEFMQSVQGKDGVGIRSFSLSEEGVLSVTLTDGSSVALGNVKGEQGEQGERGERGEQGEQGERGEQGEQGEQGETGVGVQSIEKIGTDNLTDTYKVLYTDGSFTTFTVTNGANGKSAYELYKEEYGYQGTETEWLLDLANGRLGNEETFEVTFDAQGGLPAPATQTVGKGEKLTRPTAPTKEGYTFEGWFVDGEKWSFVGYVVTENMTLTARWKPDYQITYEYNGGVETEQSVTAFTEKDLPLSLNAERTHKNDAVFGGWYLDESCILPATKLTEAKDTVVYAKWIQATDGLQYEANTLTEYTGSATEVVIAEWHNDVEITTIGNSAFDGCSELTRIEIPDSVTTIGNWAFDGCYSLTSILVDENNTAYKSIDGNLYTKDGKTLLQYAIGKTATELIIPNGVTTIGEDAFSGCSSLESIEIPDGVTTIGDRAFSGCSSLESIEIPDGVTTIGDSAFHICYNLTSIEIPASVTTIGDLAFCYCYNLTSIEIPASVTTIGDRAFYGCNNLTSIPVDENNTAYKSIDGNLYTKDGKTLLQCAIGKTATEFIIPDGVTTIGEDAFNGCYSLTSIEIPASVTTIGNSAFNDCRNLTSIEIPDGVTTIGNLAFYSCYNLTSIEISASVTTIGEDAFSSCSNLTSILVDENNTAYKSIDGNLYTKDGKTLLQCASGKTATEFIIPDGVTTIGEDAFDCCYSLTSIEIPASVTTIGNRAFSGCRNLTSIEIPASVTTIGDAAFYGCYELTSIEIPDGVTTIGNSAFGYCRGLTSVEIPASVTTIGNRAFYDCSNLTSILVDENNTAYKSIDGNLYTKDGKTLLQYASGKTATEFIIPDGVTTIGENAFGYCRSLESIEIPDGVTTIGSSAFYGCYELTTVTFENTSGWYVSNFSMATSGIDLTLTDAEMNATYLTDTYSHYYWKRK